MPDAVRNHLESRVGEWSGMLGLFLCPASRLPELITELIKATAGLSGAVRRTDGETGFTHHGIVNLLVATARVLSGKDVREALASEDAEALASEAGALSEEAAHAVRGVFASYGTPTLADPVANLEGLGLL